MARLFSKFPLVAPLPLAIREEEKKQKGFWDWYLALQPWSPGCDRFPGLLVSESSEFHLSVGVLGTACSRRQSWGPWSREKYACVLWK